MKKISFLFVLLMIVGTSGAAIKNVKYASFGTPGGNATYTESTAYYAWTQSNNNLMQMFSFSNGELANYTQLKLTFSSNSGNVRVNFVYGSGSSDNVTYNGTSEGGYFGSAGTKTITMSGLSTILSGKSKTLADVTAIRFGGDASSGTGYCTIKWSDVYLENSDDAVITGLFGTIGGNASYNVPTYSWTNASSNNLMDVFSGAAGDFSKYANGVLQFKITLDDNTNSVRIGYHDGSTFTGFGSDFYSSGTKTVDISSKSGSAASAKTIKFGAKSAKNAATSGSVTIRPDEIFLVRSEAYHRNFVADRKSTVWLPFALNAEEVAAAGTFYELTSADGTSLTFAEVATTEAYKPYVFVAKATGTPFSSMKTKTIVAPTACSYTVGNYTFHGVMKDMNVPNGSYGYNSTNGAFSKTTTDAVTIAPFRAYITVSGGSAAHELLCVFGSETTGIKTIKTTEKGNDTIYNLAGQRVSKEHRGLVIKNGRKYVVK